VVNFWLDARHSDILLTSLQSKSSTKMWLTDTLFSVGASLKTVDAVVEADGTVRLRQPMRLSGPASAVVTILVRDDEPNEATRQAIQEPIADLPRFESVDALFEELETWGGDGRMRSIIRKSQFKKDFKKLRSSNRDINVLKQAIQTLAAGEELPAGFRDHALTANYRTCRECHLAGDWLLIYQRNAETLILLRTGSHSELFN
jgi:mRNA interferase YafQ